MLSLRVRRSLLVEWSSSEGFLDYKGEMYTYYICVYKKNKQFHLSSLYEYFK